jgi:hypothetical protein
VTTFPTTSHTSTAPLPVKHEDRQVPGAAPAANPANVGALAEAADAMASVFVRARRAAELMS